MSIIIITSVKGTELVWTVRSELGICDTRACPRMEAP
jgi:hypothetical protein